MRELLDSATKRRIALIEYLDQCDDWSTAAQIAAELNTSMRTVNSDIHYLKNKWKNVLHFDISKQKGIRLRTPPYNSIKEIYYNVMEDSISFKWIEAIFLNPTKSILEWTLEFGYSEASMRRIISKCITVFERFGIVIETRPLALTSTDERKVRFFMVRYFMEAYRSAKWCPDLSSHDISNFTQKLIQSVYPQELNHFTETYAAMLYVSVVRHCQGYRQQSIPFEKYDHLFAKADLFFQENWMEFQNIFNLYPIEMNREFLYDILYFMFPFQEELSQEIFTILKQTLSTIQTVFHIPLDENEQFHIIEIMSRRIMYFQFSQGLYYIITNTTKVFALSIKENYPVFSEVTLNQLRHLYTALGNQNIDPLLDILIFVIFTEWSNLGSDLENIKRKPSIAVISDVNMKHAQLICSLIEKRFADHVNTTAFFYQEACYKQANIKKFQQYDIIVSTTPIPQFTERLIIIDTLLSKASWQYLANRIETLRAIDITKLNIK